VISENPLLWNREGFYRAETDHLPQATPLFFQYFSEITHMITSSDDLKPQLFT
jgi:hypothetical protein